MKKKNHTDSKIFIPPSDFTRWNLQYTFIENEKFLPIKKMIDKKFEVFFKQLISLSPHKEILKRRKEDILLVFYDIIYERIRTNPYLKNVVNKLSDMMNIKTTEPLKRLLKNTNTTDTNEPNYKELIKDAALRNFELTIDKVFAIPNLVLTSFGSSSHSLNKELKYVKKRADEMTGKKLTEDKKEILQKIVEKRNVLKRNKHSSHEFSWKVAIERVYKELLPQQKRDLLMVDSEMNVPNKLRDNQIKSITESIRYNQNTGNLSK